MITKSAKNTVHEVHARPFHPCEADPASSGRAARCLPFAAAPCHQPVTEMATTASLLSSGRAQALLEVQ